jgi:hypothetical protein
MKRVLSSAVVLSAVLLAACSKDSMRSIDGPLPGAFVKFFNFGINAPAVNFYSDDVKVTAISSTNCQTVPVDPKCTSTGIESASGTAYGAAGNAGLYSSLTPGSHVFAGKSVVAADNGAYVTQFTSTLAAGQYYSMYTSGFYNAATKTVESFIVQDPLPATDLTLTYVRFVNAAPNSVPMILYARNTVTGTEVAIGTAVGYKSAGTFVPLPPAPYDLNARVPGSATNIVTRLAVGFTAGHAWTVTVRGDMTATSGTYKPAFDNTVNQ